MGTGSTVAPPWQKAYVSGALLFLLNMVGSVVYVIRAAKGGWVNPQTGPGSLAGEPFIWFINILPLLVIFLPLNLAWVIVIFRREWRGVGFWLLSVLCWLCALVVDFSHH